MILLKFPLPFPPQSPGIQMHPDSRDRKMYPGRLSTRGRGRVPGSGYNPPGSILLKDISRNPSMESSMHQHTLFSTQLHTLHLALIVGGYAPLRMAFGLPPTQQPCPSIPLIFPKKKRLRQCITHTQGIKIPGTSFFPRKKSACGSASHTHRA